MKLSAETIQILENYALINSNLLIEVGDTLKTVNEAKTIFSTATIAEKFDQPYGIYALKDFLNTVSMFKNPELEFSGDVLTISDGDDATIRTKYYSADPSILTAVPHLKQLPTPTAIFKLSAINFKRIERASSTMSLQDVRFISEDGQIKAILYDESGAIRNTFTVILDSDYQGEAFDAHLKVSKLMMVNGDYTISLIGGRIIHCKNDDRDLEYIITLDVSVN